MEQSLGNLKKAAAPRAAEKKKAAAPRDAEKEFMQKVIKSDKGLKRPTAKGLNTKLLASQ